MRVLSLQIQKEGQKLHENPISTIQTCAREVIKEVTERADALDKMSQSLADIEGLLEYFESNIYSLSDIAFTQLVNDLTMPGEHPNFC